jgi:hypothetical protein
LNQNTVCTAGYPWNRYSTSCQWVNQHRRDLIDLTTSLWLIELLFKNFDWNSLLIHTYSDYIQTTNMFSQTHHVWPPMWLYISDDTRPIFDRFGTQLHTK